MSTRPASIEHEGHPANPVQAVVSDIHDDGLVEVRTLDRRASFLCEMVIDQHGAPWLEVGVRVLATPPTSDLAYGCIIGRIGRATERTPRRIDIAAGEEITLRCGKGSIVVRADGRIVVRGLDVVTRASRRNRIKGGTVEIN